MNERRRYLAGVLRTVRELRRTIGARPGQAEEGDEARELHADAVRALEGRFRLLASLLLAAFVVVLGAGCGAPPMDVGATCSAGDLRVELDASMPSCSAGSYLTGGDDCTCGEWLERLASYRRAYESRWGRVDLGAWTVRVRPPAALAPLGGFTYHGSRVVDLTAAQGFPHELHHVARGSGSDGHVGWSCPGGFGEWERVGLALYDNDTEDGYLSPCPAAP